MIRLARPPLSSSPLPFLTQSPRSDHEAHRIREIQPFVEREVATTRKSHANAEMVARAQADELRYTVQCISVYRAK
jgi:hypothetical protein